IATVAGAAKRPGPHTQQTSTSHLPSSRGWRVNMRRSDSTCQLPKAFPRRTAPDAVDRDHDSREVEGKSYFRREHWMNHLTERGRPTDSGAQVRRGHVVAEIFQVPTSTLRAGDELAGARLQEPKRNAEQPDAADGDTAS